MFVFTFGRSRQAYIAYVCSCFYVYHTVAEREAEAPWFGFCRGGDPWPIPQRTAAVALNGLKVCLSLTAGMSAATSSRCLTACSTAGTLAGGHCWIPQLLQHLKGLDVLGIQGAHEQIQLSPSAT